MHTSIKFDSTLLLQSSGILITKNKHCSLIPVILFTPQPKEKFGEISGFLLNQSSNQSSSKEKRGRKIESRKTGKKQRSNKGESIRQWKKKKKKRGEKKKKKKDTMHQNRGYVNSEKLAKKRTRIDDS